MTELIITDCEDSPTDTPLSPQLESVKLSTTTFDVIKSRQSLPARVIDPPEILTLEMSISKASERAFWKLISVRRIRAAETICIMSSSTWLSVNVKPCTWMSVVEWMENMAVNLTPLWWAPLPPRTCRCFNVDPAAPFPIRAKVPHRSDVRDFTVTGLSIRPLTSSWFLNIKLDPAPNSITVPASIRTGWLMTLIPSILMMPRHTVKGVSGCGRIGRFNLDGPAALLASLFINKLFLVRAFLAVTLFTVTVLSNTRRKAVGTILNPFSCRSKTP